MPRDMIDLAQTPHIGCKVLLVSNQIIISNQTLSSWAKNLWDSKYRNILIGGDAPTRLSIIESQRINHVDHKKTNRDCKKQHLDIKQI